MFRRLYRSCGAALLLWGAAFIASSGTNDTGNGLQMPSSGLLAVARTPSIIALDTGAVRVPLAFVEDGTAQAFWKHIAELPSGTKIYLLLNDLRAEHQPGILFHIYYDVPLDARPKKGDRRYLGAFNFFNAVRLASEPEESGRFPIDVSLDVTRALKRLAARAELSQSSALTILSSRPPLAGSNPTIRTIQLLQQ